MKTSPSLPAFLGLLGILVSAPAGAQLSLTTVTPSSSPTGGSVPVAVAGSSFNVSAVLTLERTSGASGTWISTGSFTQGRFLSALVKLTDGRVLLAGGMLEGQTTSQATTDMFDPATGLWTSKAPLNEPRALFGSALLADGRVLVSGGNSGGAVLASSEIYDPAANTWTLVGAMSGPRRAHVLERLPDGKILAVGGSSNPVTVLSAAEVFDPATGLWSSAGSMNVARTDTQATSLSDGRVLVSGGNGNSARQATAELYDPVANTWTPTGSMISARSVHRSVRLPDGRVLITGGQDDGGSIAAAEVYDAVSGSWTATGSLAVTRSGHAVILVNGEALILGGHNQTVAHATTEIYDASSNIWRAGPTLAQTRSWPAAVVLDDGRVLTASGRSGLGGGTNLNSAYLLGTTTAPITATGVTVVSSISLTATVSLAGAATGYWDVVVRQAGGLTARLPGGFKAVAALPSIPASLASSGVGLGAATISWAAGGNAAGTVYQLERSTGAGYGLRQSSTLLSYVDSTLSPGSTYYYRVRALNADLAASAYASSITVATPVLGVYPAIASITPSSSPTGGSVPVSVAGAGFAASAALALDRTNGVAGGWVSTGSFTQGRMLGQLVKLRDGRVLLAGGQLEGQTTGLVTVDMFDPATGAWTSKTPLNVGRYEATSVLLADGRVLISGGNSGGAVIASAEIYDPAANTWTVAAPMTSPRRAHALTRLPNGKVLAAGGWNSTTIVASAEIYDPAIDTWTAAGSMTIDRYSPVVTLLPNGKYLISGGNGNAGTNASAELYDPGAGTFTPTGSMGTSRFFHQQAVLPDGRVLAAAGQNASGSLTSAELYDPASGTWSATGGLAAARAGHAMEFVNGQPMIIAGYNQSVALASTEIYDASSNTWSAGPSLPQTRCFALSATLDDGRLLVASGRSGLGGGTVLNSAYLMGALSSSITATGVSVVSTASLTATVNLAGAATGYWDVVVRESAGLTARLPGGFRVDVLPLAAPSAFTGTGQSAASILWTWSDNASNETGFRVKSGAVNVSGDLAAGATSWLQTGLTANASASLLVQAFNASETADSGIATRYSLSDPPNSLTATYFGSSVAFTWPTMTNPPGTLWSVERSTDGGAAYGQRYLSSAAASYTDAGLSGGTSYYYRIRSANGDGVYSSHANATAIVYTGGVFTKIWTGLGLTAYSSEAANWSPAFAPAPGDSFEFNGASTKTCFWNSTAAVNSLTLASGFNGFAAVYMQSPVTIASVHASTGFLALASQGSTVTVTGDVIFDGQSTPVWDRGLVRLGGGLRVDASQAANYTVSPVTTTIQFYGAGFHPVTGAGLIQLPFIEIAGSSDVHVGATVDAVAQGLVLSSGRLVMGTSRRFSVQDWTQTGGQFVAGASTITFYTLGTSALSPSYVLPLAGNPFRDVQIGYGTNRPTLLKARGPLEVSNTVTLTTGAFDGGGFSHTVGGDWQELGGPTVLSSGTIRFTAGRPAFLRLAADTRFPNLSIELACATCYLTAQADATIEGTLTVSSGAWSPGAYSHRLRGDLVSPLGRMLAGTGVTTLDGSAAQTISSGSNNFYDLVVANAAGVSISGASAGLNVQRHLDIRAGARLDLSSDSIAVAGSLISSGTLTATGSTITLGGATPQTVSANGSAFGTLIVTNASTTTFVSSFTAAGLSFSQGGGALVFAAGSTFTVAALDLGASAPASRLRLRSSVSGSAWRLNVLGSAAALATDVKDSDASAGAGVVAVSTTNLDGGNNLNWIFSVPAPSGFAGTPEGQGGILWSWTDNASGETGYRVVEGTVSLSGNLPANATGWLQTGLAANAVYGPYAAQVFCGASTADSATASRRTLAAVPSGLAASAVFASSATLSWLGSAASFTLERSTGAGYSAVYSSAASSFADTGLAAASTYYARVLALNADGAASAHSSTIAVVTGQPPAPSAAVSPSGAALGVSSISWNWSLAAGATTYRLYRASDLALLGSPAAGPFAQTGLAPNAAYGLRVAAVNGGGASPLSAAATVYTLAAVPTGGAAASITSTTLVASWGLGANPASTIASLERSLDAVAFSTLTVAAVTSYADAGLLGCTTYYYRVRNANGDGVATAYASFQAVTANTVPSPPSGMNASSNAGGTISLSWGFSPTEGVSAYRLYWDAGTGAVSYAAPLAVLTSTEASYTTGVLTSSAAYTFALRAVHRCGTVETGGATAMAGAAPVLAAVRAAIKEPDSGRRVNGNRVTILAELIAGTPSDVQQIVFQYKPAASAVWLDVNEANVEHPNPDFSFPYFVHVDVTGLAPGDYDLRAVAYDLAGAPDTAPPAVRVAVDPVTPDVSETQMVDGRIKKDQTVANTVTSVVDAAGAGAADPAVRVTIPVGVVNSATATVSVIANPAITTAAPAGQSLVGSAIKIDLSNGQSALNGTAEITLTYPDTVLFPSLLQIYYLNEATGEWSRDFASTVDTASRTVTGRTPHFSTFALLMGTAFAADLSGVRAYPVPFKPNGGNPDEGRPFSPGDPNSGIIFSNLAAGSEIRIYTMTGRLVASLDSPSPTGAVRWDARNQDGRDVASGAYFAVISAAGQKNVVKKLVIIR